MYGELKVLQKLNPYEFGVECRILRSGWNRNKWNYQNVDEFYLTFVGQPILCAFPRGKVGDGHNSKVETDPATGEKYFSFIGESYEKIVGTLSSNESDFWLEDVEGETWIVGKGKLFAFYAKELVDNIVEKGVMETSAETVVYESYEENGGEVFTSWAGIGLTCLGEGVSPAIPGARIEELAAMKEEFNQLCLKAASYIGNEEDETEEEEEVPVHAEDNNDKPQEDIPKGGITTLKSFTKRQMAELAPKFNGYQVLGAGKDETGIHVVLMSADGTTAICTMGSLDEVILPERIEKAEAAASFSFGEDAQLEVNTCDITDTLSANLVIANSTIESLNKDLEEAKATIATMTENEKNRRVQAAHDKAVATLAEFNEYRDEKVEDDVLVAINAAIDNGDYTDVVTEAGQWNGEQRVADAVYAACGKKVREMDKASAANKKDTFIWEKHGLNNEVDVNGIAGLLAKAQITQ